MVHFSLILTVYEVYQSCLESMLVLSVDPQCLFPVTLYQESASSLSVYSLDLVPYVRNRFHSSLLYLTLS